VLSSVNPADSFEQLQKPSKKRDLADSWFKR